jgi:uncharacterized membrane protein
MSDQWKLPDLSLVLNSGREWLLNVLANLPEETICKVLMIFSHAWHIRNKVVHDKQPLLLDVSQCFLISCVDFLVMIKHHHGEDITKGKFILDIDEKKFHTSKVKIAKPNP